ncbi:hypothetical protein K456DRAFT_1759599 [Colletotrichum gloeosporioides 23]|nr:hypothetical protein K456DRAFT_1759599 [Colletotrichum gloeosporioides 23]
MHIARSTKTPTPLRMRPLRPPGGAQAGCQVSCYDGCLGLVKPGSPPRRTISATLLNFFLELQGSPGRLDPIDTKILIFSMATQSKVLLEQATRLEASRDVILTQTKEHQLRYNNLCQRQRSVEADVTTSLGNFATVIDILSLQESPTVQPSVSLMQRQGVTSVSHSQTNVNSVIKTLGDALKNAESLSSDAQRFSHGNTAVLCHVTRLKDNNDTTRDNIVIESSNTWSEQQAVVQQLATIEVEAEARIRPILNRASDRKVRMAKHQIIIDAVDELQVEGLLARALTAFSRRRISRHIAKSKFYTQHGAHQRLLMEAEADPLRQNRERLAKAAGDLQRGSQICDDVSRDLAQMDSDARELVDQYYHIRGKATKTITALKCLEGRAYALDWHKERLRTLESFLIFVTGLRELRSMRALDDSLAQISHRLITEIDGAQTSCLTLSAGGICNDGLFH